MLVKGATGLNELNFGVIWEQTIKFDDIALVMIWMNYVWNEWIMYEFYV